MKIIGITGTSGSGKGYISDILRDLGYKVFDADKICHEIYENNAECISEINNIFHDVITDGKVDRSKLSKIVFDDKEKLNKLNYVAHKYVLYSLDSSLKESEENGEQTVFIDAPQMYESGLDKKCSYIVSVIAPIDIKIKRITERDKISEEAAKKRLSNQYDDAFFISKSDFIINNDGKEDVYYQVIKILSSIQEGNNE